jgi:hemoglobin/transferrin/lactoferrin receptor protein
VFGSIAHTERFPTVDEVFSTSSSSATFLPSLGLRKEKSNNFEAGFALSGNDLFQGGDAGPGQGHRLLQRHHRPDRARLALLAGLQRPAGLRQHQPRRNLRRRGRGRIRGRLRLRQCRLHLADGQGQDDGAYLQTLAPHELALTLGGQLPQHDLRFGWKARIVAEPQDPARRADAPIGTSTRYARAFDVHDVFLSWTPKEGQFAGWETHLGVENIFDRQYKEFLMNDAAKGRTFKVSLSKQFGW